MKTIARHFVTGRRFLLAAILASILVPPVTAADRPLNVLFIAVDDLRPTLGCYGDAVAQTPHIDGLARRGMVFERAYCQFAVCNPLRTSVLTGCRPDTTRVYDLQTHFRTTLPYVVTLPQHFKAHGYHTQALGKVTHAIYPNTQGKEMDDQVSWSAPWWGARPHFYHSPEGMEIGRKWFVANRKRVPGVTDWRDAIVRGLAWEAPDVPDDEVCDGQVAERAVQTLRQVHGRPFFLAVGFARPHLPFVAPKKYFDLYPPDRFRAPVTTGAPRNVPACAMPHYSELSAYHGMPKTDRQLPPARARELARAYYACVSFVDAQVGRVLDELDRLGLREQTIVVLWGDHGFHLGENGFWGKGTNFELSTRAPLIVAVPGQKAAGARTSALVELVDIYPSLCAACRLPLPGGLEGTSFLPLLDTPDRPWKTAVFSQMLRNVSAAKKKVAAKTVMGYSIRTDRHRLNTWTDPERGLNEIELYDYRADPGESDNLAGRPENARLVKELRDRLQAGWRSARPAK